MIWWNKFVKRVDRWDNMLLIPQAIFLFLNMILYTIYTYQLDYIKDQWGLDITRFGYITSIPVFSFFCSIAWSAFAQRTGLYKATIVFTSILYAFLFSSLYFLQPVFVGHTENVRLGVLFCVYGLMSVSSAALFPLLDHKVYVKLNKDERFSPESFGRLRMWGPIGQGLAGFLSGQSIKRFGYGSVFVIASVMSLAFVFLVMLGIDSSEVDDQESKDHASKKPAKTSWNRAFQKLMSLEFVFFLLVVLIASYSRAVVGNLLMRYLSGYLHIRKDWSGFLVLVRSIPEILCFFFTKNLLHAAGVHQVLLFAQLAGLVRVTTYAWLPESATWAPFAIESLRGVNNAFLHASGVRLAYELAPADAQAIAQGFFHGIFGNLTTGTAGLISSFIANAARTKNPNISESEIIRMTFKSSAYASMGGLAIYAIFYFISSKSVINNKV